MTARSWPVILGILTVNALMILAVSRFGLVTGIAMLLFNQLSSSFPLTTDFSVFYANASITALVVMMGLAVYGFRVALGGQRLIAGATL